MIFIGGTGRCGTTIVAEMLAQARGVVYFGESRFLSDPGGLFDVLAGRLDAAQFADDLRGKWRAAIIHGLRRSGSEQHAARYTVEFIDRALSHSGFAEFSDVETAGALLHLLLLRLNETTRFIEKTPHTITRADLLYYMFPGVRIIHMIRNPADTCASMLEQNWGPRTPQEFLHYYNSVAGDALQSYWIVPRKNYFILDLNDLVAQPAACAERLLRFTDLDADTFDLAAMVSEEAAHQGRAKAQLARRDRKMVIEACAPIYRQWRQIMARQNGRAAWH